MPTSTMILRGVRGCRHLSRVMSEQVQGDGPLGWLVQTADADAPELTVGVLFLHV